MKRRIRGFEVVDAFHRTVPDADITLPHRGTSESAGYDLHCLETVNILPGRIGKFNTDIKAYMLPDEVLKIYPRSSIGIKRGLMLANTIPIVDADYYSNPDNDGHIVIYLRNMTSESIKIDAGERVAQCIFEKYLVADNDPEDLPKRVGGIGSTGRH